jgi:S-DNA-T family DNA segregation ATPase FtsK/SpoIIIE
VTDPKKAAGALWWAVNEMTKRYNQFAENNVRDMKGYNDKMTDEASRLPQIVIIIDELADLMMTAAKEVEDAICRLAQMARAAGIHLVIATQRPSVDVITGVIKANIPSRLAFAVSSGIDSRTILDTNGAEKLLGKGDMLFSPIGESKPIRIQGAFISDKEVESIVAAIKTEEVTYEESVLQTLENSSVQIETEGEEDELVEKAIAFSVDKEKLSISMLQRYFRIGFNRAARLMDTLESRGVVGPDEGSKPRKVL